MTCTTKDRAWSREAHALIDIARTPGLPRPTITPTGFSFSFTHLGDAGEARKDVEMAAAILSAALGVTFEPWRPPQVGSSDHYLLVAALPSGMPLSIVALAAHFDGHDIPAPRDSARILAAVA